MVNDGLETMQETLKRTLEELALAPELIERVLDGHGAIHSAARRG